MQIHELGTRTPGVYDYMALDTGSQTYKSKVGDLKPQYTSYDAANPSSWVNVDTVGSNTAISSVFEKLTYMFRNIRYLWKLLGSNDFSNVAETISGAIGNTALPTTATDISGAIAEHEGDITALNAKITFKTLVDNHTYQHSAANTWERVGASFTVPANHKYVVQLSQGFTSGKPSGIGVVANSTSTRPNFMIEAVEVQKYTVVLGAGTWYIMSMRSTASSAANRYDASAIDIDFS